MTLWDQLGGRTWSQRAAVQPDGVGEVGRAERRVAEACKGPTLAALRRLALLHGLEADGVMVRAAASGSSAAM